MSFFVKKAAVIGAGVMGAGIAAHIAGAGIPVVLFDIVPRELTDDEKNKGLTLESAVVRNRFSMGGKEKLYKAKPSPIFDKSIGNLITPANLEDDLELFRDCDLVVEVVLEKMDVKNNLFKKIAPFLKPNAIVGSNTSGISINTMVEGLSDDFKKNFLGMHFFNPPRYMKLLELIPCKETTPEVLAYMKDFSTNRLGKGVVTCKDTPNFIGNRIGTFASVVTTKLMEQYGFDFATVDLITGRVMGRPKSGTFRTIDMVGIDVFSHVIGNVINNVQDKEESAQFIYPDYFNKLIAAGRLGDKTRQGFYKKEKGADGKFVSFMYDVETNEYKPAVKIKNKFIDKVAKESGLSGKLNALVYSEEKEGKFAWDLLKAVLLYSAAKVPEISDDFKEIDNAIMWGYNWDKGPFLLWDMIGVQKSVDRMKAEGDKIPAWVEKMLADGKTTFYTEEDKFASPFIMLASPKTNVLKENSDARLIDLGDGVACVEFRSKGNSLTTKIGEILDVALEEVDKNFKGLVLGNQGSNFCAGANLDLIIGLAIDEKWAELETEISKLHDTNMKFKYFTKPIVAAPFGMVLGGGAEVAMHAHKCVAAAETYMGLVEVGVGLVPAGGGIKEFLIRGTQDAAKLADVDLFPFVFDMWKKVFSVDVATSGFAAVSKNYLKTTDRIILNKDALIDEAKDSVLTMVKEGFRPLATAPIKVIGTTGAATLAFMVDQMVKGEFISEYDGHIGNKIAHIMTGGNVPRNSFVTEQHILDLEKEAFLSLCGEEKTMERIAGMLRNGKPVRN